MTFRRQIGELHRHRENAQRWEQELQTWTDHLCPVLHDGEIHRVPMDPVALDGPPAETKVQKLVFKTKGEGPPSKEELAMMEKLERDHEERPTTCCGPLNRDQVRDHHLKQVQHTYKKIDSSCLLHQILPKRMSFGEVVKTDLEQIEICQKLARTSQGQWALELMEIEATDLTWIEPCLEFLKVLASLPDDPDPSDEPPAYKKRFVDQLAQEQKVKTGRGPPDESGTRTPWNKQRGGSAHFGGLLTGLAPPSPYPIDGTLGAWKRSVPIRGGSTQKSPSGHLQSGDNTGA